MRPRPALTWDPEFAVFRPNRAMRRQFGDLASAERAWLHTRYNYGRALRLLFWGPDE